jgi:hypothetical protein
MIQLEQINFRKTFENGKADSESLTQGNLADGHYSCWRDGHQERNGREGSNHTSKVAAVDDAYIKIDANKSILALCIWPNGEDLRVDWAMTTLEISSNCGACAASGKSPTSRYSILLY